MATDQGSPLDITLQASGDLSTKQYRFVTIDSNGQIAVATRGALCAGVLQNKPGAAGRAGTVRPLGVTKICFGGTVAPGNPIVSDANGLAVTAASADNAYMGICLEGGDATNIGSMLLQPRGLS